MEALTAVQIRDLLATLVDVNKLKLGSVYIQRHNTSSDVDITSSNHEDFRNAFVNLSGGATVTVDSSSLNEGNILFVYSSENTTFTATSGDINESGNEFDIKSGRLYIFVKRNGTNHWGTNDDEVGEGSSDLTDIGLTQNEDIETESNWDTYVEHTVVATLTTIHNFTLPKVSATRPDWVIAGQRIAFRWQSGNGINIHLQDPNNEGFTTNPIGGTITINEQNPYVCLGVPLINSAVWQVLQTNLAMAGTASELWEEDEDGNIVAHNDVSILGNDFLQIIQIKLF